MGARDKANGDVRVVIAAQGGGVTSREAMSGDRKTGRGKIGASQEFPAHGVIGIFRLDSRLL